MVKKNRKLHVDPRFLLQVQDESRITSHYIYCHKCIDGRPSTITGLDYSGLDWWTGLVD